MKSLQVVQKMMNVLRILTLIGMIIGIVGAAICVAGIVALFAIPSLGEYEFMQMTLAEMAVKSTWELAVLSIAEIFVVTAEIVVLAFAYKYFRNELTDGTPFTHLGAGELRRLGILNIVLPLVGVIIASIVTEIAGINAPFSNEAEVGTGVALILLSLVFAYGADLEEKGRMNKCEEEA